LVEGKPISIGNVAYVLGMNTKKLHRWYQHTLSGFSQAVEKGEIGKHNLYVKQRGVVKETVVPILEEKNLGEQMGIDEKTISGVTYTILSNRKTSKIALMAATLKVSELMQLIKQFDIEKRMQVRSLSRDMASNYDWFGRQSFMNAYHVIDKFHVVKNIIEQLQSIRIRYRQQELARRREANQNKQKYIETVFSNGDTVLQLLARSRGLLFLLPDEWGEQQKQRSKILFEQYPELKTAYQLVLAIRQWFKPPKGKTTYSVTRNRKKQQLTELLKMFVQSGIEEIKNIAFMIKKNITQILNYFIAKETNAKAEALNQNLQRFINVNYGARNSDFFLFRVKVHFS
jgi:transposase